MIKGWIQSFWQQLQNNFRLASLTLFSFIAVFFLGPFAIYRLLIGDYLESAIEFLMLSALAANTLWAWRREDALIPATIVAIIVTMTAAALIVLLGDVAIYWAYVALIINLVLTQRHVGLLLNIALIATTSLQADAFATPIHLNAFIATGALVSLYAFIFATQTQQQRQRLKLQAERDPLTGIGNRRLLESSLPDIARRNSQETLPHSIAILDLDRFKQVNDAFGHAAGDRVLQDLAGLLEQTTRGQDRVFRIGGEEFVLLMPETTLDGARIVLEKIRSRIEDKLSSPGGAVTVSIGVAEIDPADSNWASWLERADRALYSAKRQGRNTVQVCEAYSANESGETTRI
jgi:diguanylate cyclase